MGLRVEVFGKILSAIVKSVFFSGVIFIIFFSIVTGGFPPDFRKIKKAFGSAQEMAKMSKPAPRKIPISNEENMHAYDDERDVTELETFNRKRALLGEGFFGADSHSEEEEVITPLRSIGSVPQDDLKTQLIDMQQEIFRLQQRVSELEEQAKEKSTAEKKTKRK